MRDDAANEAFDVDRIRWWDETGEHKTRVSNARRLNDVMPTKRARRAPKYKGQISFQGHYWFERTGRLVWHESMAEHSWLMMFDYVRNVRAVSAQPFILEFSDGTTHTPDYLFDVGDTRLVLNVHPEVLTTERDLAVFAQTERICGELGWESVVVDQMSDVTAWNLEMLSRYRHPMFEPTQTVRKWILRAASVAPRFGDLRTKLITDKPGELIPALMHLLWKRELLLDLDPVFNDDATVAVA